jgi:hypothetical protein
MPQWPHTAISMAPAGVDFPYRLDTGPMGSP